MFSLGGYDITQRQLDAYEETRKIGCPSRSRVRSVEIVNALPEKAPGAVENSTREVTEKIGIASTTT